MRALAMDFRSDGRVLNIGDQFMFGPAILVNPVTEQGATTRHLYLPKAEWYDFWTGSTLTGGRTMDAAAPLDRIPLYVRAGSIVPMGPDVEHTTEKPADPLELRIYRGADGDFRVYEDENDSLQLRKGRLCDHPHPLGRRRKDADHRRAQGQLSGNAGKPHVPNRVCRPRSRNRHRPDPAGR